MRNLGQTGYRSDVSGEGCAFVPPHVVAADLIVASGVGFNHVQLVCAQ
jgi:hypothetical protein